MLRWTKFVLLAVAVLLAVSANVRSQEWTAARGLHEWGFPDNPWTFRHGEVPLEPRLNWEAANTFAVAQAALAPKVKPNAENPFLPGWFVAPDQAHLKPESKPNWVKGDLVVHTTDPTNGGTHGEANVIWKSPVSGKVLLSGKAWQVHSRGRGNQWAVSHIKNGEAATSIGKGDLSDDTTREKPSRFFDGEGKVVAVSEGDVIELRIVKTSDVGDFVGVEFAIKVVEREGTNPKTLEGEYLIESALKPGMVLDVTDAKSDDYTLIQLAGPGDQKNRRWRLIRVGDGEYTIETALKANCFLDARDAKSDDGTLLILGNGGDQPNRRWRLIAVGNGEFMIETALKKKVFLDVKDARAENGAAIQLGGNADEGKDQGNRRWRLLRVDVIAVAPALARPQEKIDNQIAVLAGEWKVTFPKDFIRVYTIETDGKVSHTSADGKLWKGQITRKDGMLLLYFEGGSAIERLTLGADGRLFSEYWDPKADFPDRTAHLVGIGARQK
jgi:hypothetical protein